MTALADDVIRFLTDPRARLDPYPLLRRLQGEDPIHRTANRTWFVTRYADVLDILTKKPVSIDYLKWGNSPQLRQPSDYLRLMMSLRDPPDHDRLNRVISRFFAHRSVAPLRSMIEEVVDEMLAHAPENGCFDLIRDLGRDLPVYVNCKFLGIPRNDWPLVADWTDLLSRMIAQAGAMPSEIESFAAYLANFVAATGNNGNAVILALADAQTRGEITEKELIAFCMLLLMSGRDTATNMIGNSVVTLLLHPDQALRLKNDPQLVRSGLEECLRFESPVRAAARIAAEGFSINGHAIRQGDVVLALLAAANRDPERFSNPDAFDAGREENPHLAFGAGCHVCLGRAFARLEGEAILDRLFRRWAGIELAIPAEDLSWSDSLPFRGVTSLPVILHRG